MSYERTFFIRPLSGFIWLLSEFIWPLSGFIWPLSKDFAIIVTRNSVFLLTSNCAGRLPACSSSRLTLAIPNDASCWSSIRRPDIDPSFSTPNSRMPASPLSEKSFANAQTAWPILSALSNARVISTRSLSPPAMIVRNSSTVIFRFLTGLYQDFFKTSTTDGRKRPSDLGLVVARANKDGDQHLSANQAPARRLRGGAGPPDARLLPAPPSRPRRRRPRANACRGRSDGSRRPSPRRRP